MQVNANGIATTIDVLSGGEMAWNGGAVSGLSLASGATLDLLSFAFSRSETLAFSAAMGGTQGTLTVTSGADSFSVVLLGQYVAAGFSIAKDGAGDTAITYTPTTWSVEIAGAGHV
jgi:hypothetical protein